MASFIKHGLFQRCTNIQIRRRYATKIRQINYDKKKTPLIDDSAKSIAAKGFLRSQKSYTPAPNVSEKFKEICNQILKNKDTNITDLSNKYELLNECNKEFNHAVPNSLLHEINNLNDILQFYKTPVNTTVPLDMMKNIDLPENVHIQYEYHRFHPDTDTMFNGVTAYPRSSTLVTGLKYKKKYKGFEARTTWPYNT